MTEKEKLLRSIPNVDRLLRSLPAEGSGLPRAVVTEAIRETLDGLRNSILSGDCALIPPDDDILTSALDSARKFFYSGVSRVINGTGVILHSNLGRACLSEKAARAAYRAASGFSTLEYDLEAGSRGSRTLAAENLLRRITGAESAVIVNNNAAACLLILTAMAKGGHVVVSRGELVEIGGSFRVNEVMEQSGCFLREVGATNKTKISDYEKALDGEDVKAILKVHTSNFKIVGFTESVSSAELVQLGKKRGIPVIEDIGSGALVNMERFAITGEPYVKDSLKQGVDVVSFSGDKLLGGPQAGIILGSETHLSLMRRHPLYRALRADKMTLAALEETLRAYLDEKNAESELPTLRMISASASELEEKAKILHELLAANGVSAEVVATESEIGCGSVPGFAPDSYAVSVDFGLIGAAELDRRLRMGETPVLGRIVKDCFLLDVRTIFDDELETVAAGVAEALGEAE